MPGLIAKVWLADGATNKAIIQQVNQALNDRDWDTLRTLMSSEFVDGLRASWILAAFPDIHTTLDDILVDGDKVVTRWTNRGTHTAPFMGVAPTGRQVSYTGISIDRLETGKIVESWRNSDILGVLRQIGGFATD